jgi:hypothetical protein
MKTAKTDSLTITDEDLAQEYPVVRGLLKSTMVPERLASLVTGPYGYTHQHLHLLDVMEKAGSLILEIQVAISHRIHADRQGSGFGFSNQLNAVDVAFCSLYASYVASDSAVACLTRHLGQPVEVRGQMKAPWIRTVRELEGRMLMQTVLQELGAFLDFHRTHPDPLRSITTPDQLLEVSSAFFQLATNALRHQLEDVEFERYRRAIEKLNVEICGRGYRGLDPTTTAVEEEPAELLPVWPEDVVGNQEYLAAGLRLARDVAGYDLTTKRNPKKLNPVLFGQGSPGCGKTVTAHAIGNYFLQYCRERGVPARFLVIRRTDWASSFQNASATQLIKIFKEQVQGFEGVVGVYWPDIDTAFAARTDPGMRSEESNILGASFGIFDGTLIPKNGKWFLICDANYMNMDEATLSRISQDPHKILGPNSAEDFVELMRDKKLKDFHDMLPLSEEEWLKVGQLCIDSQFSGRNVESICQKILTDIQDVEPPPEYYQVGFDERQQILRSLARPMTFEHICAVMKRYSQFEQVAEEQNQADMFQSRVKEIVLNLSAQKAALQTLGEVN